MPQPCRQVFLSTDWSCFQPRILQGVVWKSKAVRQQVTDCFIGCQKATSWTMERAAFCK